MYAEKGEAEAAVIHSRRTAAQRVNQAAAAAADAVVSVSCHDRRHLLALASPPL